jgi:peptide-methionine (S)-S-oxide reductase
VCNGRTGHAEVVQVYYDPKVISFQTLVQAFFASHNPTTLNRQGNDVGEQYRSVAFYRNANEKATIVAEIEKVKQSGKYANKIVTQVVPFTKFYPAEEYHQEYIYNHPDNGYVQNVSIPDYLEFRKKFKADYK